MIDLFGGAIGLDWRILLSVLYRVSDDKVELFNWLGNYHKMQTINTLFVVSIINIFYIT